MRTGVLFFFCGCCLSGHKCFIRVCLMWNSCRDTDDCSLKGVKLFLILQSAIELPPCGRLISRACPALSYLWVRRFCVWVPRVPRSRFRLWRAAMSKHSRHGDQLPARWAVALSACLVFSPLLIGRAFESHTRLSARCSRWMFPLRQYNWKYTKACFFSRVLLLPSCPDIEISTSYLFNKPFLLIFYVV